ncbi:MAG: hypothetical protein RLZZ215_2884 [Pseudomonadota bacterium]|jgi:hypothetical protein
MRYKHDRHTEQHSAFKMNALAAETYRDSSGHDGCAELTMMEDAEEIASGNLSSIEGRLIAQAITLDTVFTELVGRAHTAMSYSSEGVVGAERYLRWALKAQAQSANTMKILAEIKQPKSITIANQANIARNQIVTTNPNHARGNFQADSGGVKMPNELIQIGDIDHATLDTRSAGTPFNFDENQDTAMATVAAINRRKNSGR